MVVEVAWFGGCCTGGVVGVCCNGGVVGVVVKVVVAWLIQNNDR